MNAIGESDLTEAGVHDHRRQVWIDSGAEVAKAVKLDGGLPVDAARRVAVVLTADEIAGRVMEYEQALLVRYIAQRRGRCPGWSRQSRQRLQDGFQYVLPGGWPMSERALVRGFVLLAWVVVVVLVAVIARGSDGGHAEPRPSVSTDQFAYPGRLSSRMRGAWGSVLRAAITMCTATS